MEGRENTGLKRVALFAIPDAALRRAVRARQRGLSALTGDRLALRFPVHITLRGPFQTNARDLPGLSESIRRRLRSFRPFPVVLHGPVTVDPGLCWFEVPRGGTGFSTCLGLHELLEEMTGPHVVEDLVSPGHKGVNYRPHVTLGWNVHPPETRVLSEAPVDLTATMGAVALVRYPDDWPSSGSVRVIESIPLTGVS